MDFELLLIVVILAWIIFILWFASYISLSRRIFVPPDTVLVFELKSGKAYPDGKNHIIMRKGTRFLNFGENAYCLSDWVHGMEFVVRDALSMDGFPADIKLSLIIKTIMKDDVISDSIRRWKDLGLKPVQKSKDVFQARRDHDELMDTKGRKIIEMRVGEVAKKVARTLPLTALVGDRDKLAEGIHEGARGPLGKYSIELQGLVVSDVEDKPGYLELLDSIARVRSVVEVALKDRLDRQEKDPELANREPVTVEDLRKEITRILGSYSDTIRNYNQYSPQSFVQLKAEVDRLVKELEGYLEELKSKRIVGVLDFERDVLNKI